MVELIFVIVILGILAAVAIPKLAATRDDAKMARLAQNIMTTAFEISSYAVAGNDVDPDFKVMSNTATMMDKEGEVVLSADQADYNVGSASPCVRLAIDRNVSGGVLYSVELEIDTPNSGVDELCDRLHSIVEKGVFPITLRGQSVTYD